MGLNSSKGGCCFEDLDCFSSLPVPHSNFPPLAHSSQRVKSRYFPTSTDSLTGNAGSRIGLASGPQRRRTKNAFQRTKSFLDLAIVSHPAKMINGPKQFPVLMHELLKSIGEERAGGGFARIGVADRASPPSSFACEVFTFTRIQPHR